MDPSEERGKAPTSYYPSYLVQLANHVIIRGGEVFLDLSTLKVAVLVNSSVIIVHMFSIFIIKRGCFNDLGESVMCDKDSLLSLWTYVTGSLWLEGSQARCSGRCTLVEHPLPDWYAPFGSLSPSRWQGTGLSQSEASPSFSAGW